MRDPPEIAETVRRPCRITQTEATTVICPKCGYEQEERLDCRKCGIVFSKYLAMQSETSGTPPGPAPQAENGASVEILELRQHVRDLNHRFSEVEFERVERSQLRGEMKALDKKLEASSDQMARRLEDLERLLSTPKAPPPAPDGALMAQVQKEILEANVDPIAKRLAEAEDKLHLWENELASSKVLMNEEVNRLMEAAMEPLARRVEAIEQKLQYLELGQAPSGESVTTDIMGRLEARLSDLESKAGAPYAVPPEREPLQEAISGYQDLDARIQALANQFAEVKPSTDKLPALQEELAGLRAETGKIWAQILSVEENLNRPPAPAPEPSPNERLELELRSIRESLQEIREFIAKVTSRT